MGNEPTSTTSMQHDPHDVSTEETTLLILGASGDLTSRLLLPALGQLLRAEPQRHVHLAGAGLDDLADEDWQRRVGDAFATTGSSDAVAGLGQTTYTKADITSADDLRALVTGTRGRLAIYFAVPPAVAVRACEALRDVDLPDGTMLALEKPFGLDQASAHDLNTLLAGLLPEEQIFRVDHFLGRSMLLNILGVRFANRVLEPVWTADDVESVVVRYDEALGLEGRAGYYDGAGAMIDMIQSHLLQVLALIAMEAPATLGQRDLRDATAAALRATHVWDDDATVASRRARYTAGTIEGRSLPSYADEQGVDAARGTETLAEVRFGVRNNRWQGVPFTLRSGKAIGDPRREVVVQFKRVRHLPTGFTGGSEGSVLRFTLGPDTMSLELNTNGNADPFELSREHLVADLGEGARKAYAEVLSGLLDGDPTLSVRDDAAEECWRIIQPIRDAFAENRVPLAEYPAGTPGPEDWQPLDPPDAAPAVRASSPAGSPPAAG